jgi:nucleoside triphosphatase
MAESRFPEVTCGGLILNAEGEIFLMKSPKWDGAYCIPGGHVELGETLEQALVREIKEETNLDVFDIEFLCFQESIFDPGFWQKKHFIFFDYTCKTKSTAVVLNSEGSEHLWIKPVQALSLPINRYSKHVIEQFLAKNKVK